MNDKAIEQQMLQNAIQQVKQKYNEGTDDLVRTESLGLYKEGTIMILDVRLVYSNGNKYIVSV